MKTPGRNFIVFFFLLWIFSQSCQKETGSEMRISNEIDGVKVQISSDLGSVYSESASKLMLESLAKLSLDKVYRELVYSEIEKKFDGESNCLIIGINSSYMSKEERNSNVSTAFDSIIVQNRTKGLYPQIYIHDSYMKKRNTLKIIEPKIYFIDALNASDKDMKFPGYYIDTNGDLTKTSFLIDEQFAMENEVWILSLNERVTFNGVLRSIPFLKDQRVGTQHEYMMSIRCPNLSEIEGWIKGAPELRCVLKSAKGTIAEQWFYPDSRNAIDNVWWTINGTTGRYLYYWDIESYTKTVLFSWVEWDGFGNTNTYSNNFVYKDIDPITHMEFTSTANYSFNYQSWDMLCGSITVHIDDGMLGDIYQTGLIDFIDAYK